MTEHVPELLAEFDSISDPKMAAINAKNGLPTRTLSSRAPAGRSRASAS